MLAFHLVSCQGSKVEFEQNNLEICKFSSHNLKDISVLKCENTACKKIQMTLGFLMNLIHVTRFFKTIVGTISISYLVVEYIIQNRL